MLKPEALPYKEQIMGMIEKAGMPIVEWRHFQMEEKHLKAMYPTLSGEKLHKTKEYLLGKDVLAAVVEGDNVIDRLHKVCGEHVKPFLCDSDSIRNQFRNITPSDETFPKNIIHRPKTKQEAEEHLVLFFPDR